MSYTPPTSPAAFAFPYPYTIRSRHRNNWPYYIAFVVITAYIWSNLPLFGSRNRVQVGIQKSAAVNATLGFEKILALSQSPSWRTHGLQAAANLTGLTITIPPHPYTSPKLGDAFANLGAHDIFDEDGELLREGDAHPSHGAAMAWLAHMDIIKYVIMQDYETALILEDDVDWDVRLKEQMLKIAPAVRGFAGVHDVSQNDQVPYGNGWDILWIGHCRETIDDSRGALAWQEFFDDTRPSSDNYTGWGKDDTWKLKEGHRAVLWANEPLCTFAYAVSRRGAARILEWAGAGKGEAFDVKLMWGCKPEGPLRCVMVYPEVVHQYFPPESLEYHSAVDLGNGDTFGGELDEGRFEEMMGSTANIIRSARCEAIWGVQEYPSPCWRRDTGIVPDEEEEDTRPEDERDREHEIMQDEDVEEEQDTDQPKHEDVQEHGDHEELDDREEQPRADEEYHAEFGE